MTKDEPLIRNFEVTLDLIRPLAQSRQDARSNRFIHREAEERFARCFLFEGLLDREESELIFYHLCVRLWEDRGEEGKQVRREES